MTTDIFLSPVHLRTQLITNVSHDDDTNENEENEEIDPEEIPLKDDEDEDGFLHDINDDQKFKDEDDLIDGDFEEEEEEFIEEEEDGGEDDYGDGREK